ncbi:MAG: class I SAM-dependent methyltransferase [Bacillus sp. (in: Bacteria)]|nr:class I SAM-dependent methyltransferase [Bacillus sp. (in: firmicutes)]
MNDLEQFMGKMRDQSDSKAIEEGGISFFHEMADSMNLVPGMKVLEIGCGLGFTAVYIAQKYDVHVIAHDMWTPPTDIFATTEGYNGPGLILPVHGDPLLLPFANQYFDAIFSVDGYGYLQSSPTYLDYLLSFLKPSGILTLGGIVTETEKMELILVGEMRFIHENGGIKLSARLG